MVFSPPMTVASHTCVLRPPCTSRASPSIAPRRAAPPRAAGERDALPPPHDGRVPPLRVAPAVHEPRLAIYRPLTRGAEKVALEFYGRETRSPLGQAHERAVAAGGIRERHDRRGVQGPVRGHKLRPPLPPR